MRIIAMLAILPVLASCSAADDPDNIPVKGVWEVDYRISSIRAGNIFMGADELPNEFKRLASSDRRCVEPRFATKEDFIEDFSDHMQGTCEMRDYETTDTTMRAAGQCGNIGAMDYAPAIRVKGDIAPEDFKMVLTFEGGAEIPGAGRRLVTMIAVAEAKRVGDC